MQLQHVALALQAADDVARHLAAEGSANRSSPAQLFAGFLAQTAAIIAAWQRGKRFRFGVKIPRSSTCRTSVAWCTMARLARRLLMHSRQIVVAALATLAEQHVA